MISDVHFPKTKAKNQFKGVKVRLGFQYAIMKERCYGQSVGLPFAWNGGKRFMLVKDHGRVQPCARAQDS